MNILILCTGNSCRSQMAEGILKSMNPQYNVNSAGTLIAKEVHPKAVLAMQELNIDISDHHPKQVDQFLNQNFDYVITVCDHAKESCPVFMGSVEHRAHIGFEDPAEAIGTDEEIMQVFRHVRDEIHNHFKAFSQSIKINS